MDPFSGGSTQPAAQPQLETEIRPIEAPKGRRPKRGLPAGQTFMGDAGPGPASGVSAGAKTFMGQ